MRKSKELARQLIALSSAIVVSACTVTVKDKEVCADLGVAGAHCAHTYIEKRRDIPKAVWDKERIGWMCMHADDFSDTEDSLDELCRTTNLCDYRTKEELKKLRARLAPVVKKAKSVSKPKQ